MIGNDNAQIERIEENWMGSQLRSLLERGPSFEPLIASQEEFAIVMQAEDSDASFTLAAPARVHDARSVR